MARKAKITIHPAYKIGEISPRLFSAFLEPIGTIVNGSMYNPKHPTADEQGFRKDWIDALKATNVPAVRLPGGNFVSGWDWKDSIGPKENRKTHLDLAWHQYITNEVGHDEYLQWAEKVNTESMYTINLGTGNINDAISCIEYSNHEGGTYWSDLRSQYGHEKPYDIKTWYLGNEMDGPWQIGSWEKNPAGYGRLANEVSKAMKWVDGRIETVACVSCAPFMAHYPQWDHDVLEQCYESVDYISMHHYHGAPEGDYAALLGGTVYFEDYINTEIALCDYMQTKLRSNKKMMLSFDEYGTMVRPPREFRYGGGIHNMYEDHYVFDPNRKFVLHDPDNMVLGRKFPDFGDMLPALANTATLLAFLRHADRVKIACMTGGLGTLAATNREHVWKSASYYPFTQLMRYAKGVSLNTIVDCETFDIPGYCLDDNSQYKTKEGVPFVDTATAYNEEDGELTVFVINRNWQEDQEVEIDVNQFPGYHFVEHIQMFEEDMKAKNTYEDPNRVVPKMNESTTCTNGIMTATTKRLSWNVFRFEK